MSNIYKRNFLKLEAILGGNLQEVFDKYGYLKLKAEGFMDLSVDIVGKNKIAIAHNFEQNGDIVPDPDMEIEIDLVNKTAEALTFQNMYIFSEVYEYNDKGEKTGLRPRLKRELNEFLEMWLKNLIDQGHIITEKKEEE